MTKSINLAALTVALLTACTSQQAYVPYGGPVASPQVAYRIDTNRFFEVVPLERLPCGRARLYYTDKVRGIHTDVASWDRVADGTIVIDAANDQYLVAPIILSDSSCQTGDGSSLLCASRLPYSIDAGRTWQYNIPRWSGYDVFTTGHQVYTGGAWSTISDLRPGYVAEIWHELPLTAFTRPTSAPMDNHLRCNRVGKE